MKKIVLGIFVLAKGVICYGSQPTFAQLIAATNNSGTHTTTSSGSAAPSTSTLSSLVSSLSSNTDSSGGSSQGPSEKDLLSALQSDHTDTSSSGSGPSEKDLLSSLSTNSAKNDNETSSDGGVSEKDVLASLEKGTNSSGSSTAKDPDQASVLKALADKEGSSTSTNFGAAGPSASDLNKAIDEDEKTQADEEKRRSEQNEFVKNLLLNSDYEKALGIISDSNLTSLYHGMMTNILLGHYLNNQDMLTSAAQTMSSVVAKYAEALQHFTAAYTTLHIPITLEKSTDVYGIFLKIVQAYAQWYIIYKQNILKAVAVHQDYASNVDSLITHYATYNASMMKVIKVFPAALQDKATKLYHAYLIDNLMQLCVNLLQDYGNRGLLSDADIVRMQHVYNIVWQIQFDGIQVMGFSSYQDFISKITSTVAGVYVENADSLLKKLDFAKDMAFNSAFFDTATAYYQKASAIYEQGGQMSASQDALAKVASIKAQKDGILTTLGSYNSAVALVEKDADLFPLPVDEVEKDLTKLRAISESLVTAKHQLDDVQKKFTQVGDDVHASLANVKSLQAEADLFIRQAQIMWLAYLQADQQQLQNFFEEKRGAWSVEQVEGSFKKIQLICTKFPNAISQVSAIIPALQQALKLYGDQGVSLSDGHSSNTELIKLINDAIVYLQNVSSWIDTLGLISSTEMVAHADGLADIVQQSVSKAKALDDAYANNSSLGTLVPNFALSVMPKGLQTYQSIAAVYAYAVAISQADVLLDQAQKTTNQIDKINLQASALSYYSATKSVESFLSSDQKSFIDHMVAQLSAAVDVASQAQQAVAVARACSDWTAENAAGRYASKATALWQKAINMNYIAVSVAASDKVSVALNAYFATVAEYVALYQKHAPAGTDTMLNEILLYYRLYLGYVALHENDDAQKALTTINSLMFNDAHTGLLNQIEQLLLTEKSEKDASVAYQDEEKIASLVVDFESLVHQQHLVAQQIARLCNVQEDLPVLFLKTLSGDQSSVLSLVESSVTKYVVTVPNFEALQVAHALAQGDSYFAQAEKLEQQEKFYEAGQQYTLAENNYKKAVLTSKDSATVASAKQKYFLSVTRAKASLLAGMIVDGSEQTTVKGIDAPKDYFIRQYQVEVPMSFIGALPSSLASFQGKGFVPISSTTLSAAKNIFDSFVMDQILQSHQMTFDDCYQNKNLKRKDNLTATTTQKLNALEVDFNSFQQRFNTDHVLSDDHGGASSDSNIFIQQNGITFSWSNFPIDAATPLYVTVPYGAEYAIGAYALFKPGTQLLQLGGGGPAYVPGQDVKAAEKMQNRLGQMYLAQALQSVQEATKLQNMLLADVKKDISSKAFKLDSYMVEFQEIMSLYNSSLSLLMSEGQSAKAYFDELKNTKSSVAIMSYVGSVYQQQADFVKQCLVGDPTAPAYSTILKDLNMIYLSQGSLPGAKQTDFSVKIAELFKQAGDACMSYEYVDSMTGLKQHHCIMAATNYAAAGSQYDTLGDQSSSRSMKILSNKAYFYACAENIQSYFAVKSNGANYVDSTGVTEHVTWEKLMSDYASFENQYSLQSTMGIDANEIALYNGVKNLLLDAAIYYQVVDNNFGQLVQDGTRQADDVVHAALVAFAKDHQAIDASAKDISYLQSGVDQKIGLLAVDGYTYFKDDMQKLAAWAGTLFQAVGYTYIYDYLGGISGDTEEAKTKDAQTKWNSVTQAMQIAGTAIQNPSAAYVG